MQKYIASHYVRQGHTIIKVYPYFPAYGKDPAKYKSSMYCAEVDLWYKDNVFSGSITQQYAVWGINTDVLDLWKFVAEELEKAKQHLKDSERIAKG